MDKRPSLGVRLKADAGRSFFENIIIYDLGQEPDSVNVYYYYKPTLSDFDHSSLDMEDRSGKVEITWTFEPEGQYFVIGQNRSKLKGAIQTILNYSNDSATSDASLGHATMLTQSLTDSVLNAGSILNSLTGLGQSILNTSIINPLRTAINVGLNSSGVQFGLGIAGLVSNPVTIQNNINTLTTQLSVLYTKSQSGTATTAEQAQITSLQQERDNLVQQLNDARKQIYLLQQTSPSTVSATTNTQITTNATTTNATPTVTNLTVAQQQQLTQKKIIVGENIINRLNIEIAQQQDALNQAESQGLITQTDYQKTVDYITGLQKSKTQVQTELDTLRESLNGSS